MALLPKSGLFLSGEFIISSWKNVKHQYGDKTILGSTQLGSETRSTLACSKPDGSAENHAFSVCLIGENPQGPYSNFLAIWIEARTGESISWEGKGADCILWATETHSRYFPTIKLVEVILSVFFDNMGFFFQKVTKCKKPLATMDDILFDLESSRWVFRFLDFRWKTNAGLTVPGRDQATEAADSGRKSSQEWIDFKRRSIQRYRQQISAIRE